MRKHFEAGQVWTRGKGVWETGKRIVEVDQSRRSVIFLKTMPLHGGMGEYHSVRDQGVGTSDKAVTQTPDFSVT